LLIGSHTRFEISACRAGCLAQDKRQERSAVACRVCISAYACDCCLEFFVSHFALPVELVNVIIQTSTESAMFLDLGETLALFFVWCVEPLAQGPGFPARKARGLVRL
jgi:hypothetical protein